MSANCKISELSPNRMVLDRITVAQKIILNFTTPDNWKKGDIVAMQINRPPYGVHVEGATIIFEMPKEPANGWEREFYTLYNERTKDRITVDFDWVERVEGLKSTVKQV